SGKAWLVHAGQPERPRHADLQPAGCRTRLGQARRALQNGPRLTRRLRAWGRSGSLTSAAVTPRVSGLLRAHSTSTAIRPGGCAMNKVVSMLLWGLLAAVGAFAFATLALKRGESVNAVWLVTAALAVYFIAYRFYSKYIAERVLELNDARPTPAVRHNDGMDYVPTNKWVLYGHPFAA